MIHSRYGPGGLNMFSQGCVLENDSHCGKGGKSIHSKDMGGKVEPLFPQVQPEGQAAVMNSG